MMAKNTAQARQKDILQFLTRRFGPVPDELAAAVQAIYEESKLDEPVDMAASCANLETFQWHLARSPSRA
jgi:hypothetical protein